MTHHCIPLDLLAPSDLPQVGAKAMNLNMMMKCGLQVPPGYVIMTDMFVSFIHGAGIADQIHRLLDQADYSDPSHVKKVADEIGTLMRHTSLSGPLEQEIMTCFRTLGLTRVAVRSSAINEDTETSSSAGQQETFLNVTETNLLSSILSCWISYYSHRALMYRHAHHLDDPSHPGGIAVVVQNMVQSEQSGVAFSVDPVTGDDTRVVIEAICGLGELIVGGEVTPDYYVVQKSDVSILTKRIMPQTMQLVWQQGQNVHIPLAPMDGESQKISDQMILQIAELVKKVETYAGCPQDIEWAIAHGQLWLLQVRAITT